MGARRIVVKPENELNLSSVMRSRAFMLGVLGLCLLICVALVLRLNRPDSLPFKTIQVYGELHWLNKDELNALITKNIDGGFFSLDVNHLKQVLEQQAWIKLAAIRRVWPDVLQITVTEQQPVAVWNDESVVNKDGDLFSPDTPQLPAYIVRIYGPHGTYHGLITHYQALAEMTDSVGLKLDSIRLNERRALQVTLTNGVQILLGRVRNIDESTTEMQRFLYAYKANLASKLDSVNLVDLRYTNGLAVRWKQSSKSDQQKQMQRVASGDAAQG